MSARAVIALAAALFAAAPGARACEVALVLAMDVSGSVDAYEFELQTRGIALALREPDVADALTRGRVALAVVQWSGATEQTLTLPWVEVTEPADVARLAVRVAAMPRAHVGGTTAVGEAIRVAAGLFDRVRHCARRVIDVSGDGDENDGHTVGAERRNAWARGIAINGLAIEAAGPGTPISSFYRNWVVTPGGFVITAQQHDDFARAMREKLLRELITPLSAQPPAPLRLARGAGFVHAALR